MGSILSSREWVVGVYAPNQATHRIALWGSLLQNYVWAIQDYLWVISTRDYVDASESTFEH